MSEKRMFRPLLPLFALCVVGALVAGGCGDSASATSCSSSTDCPAGQGCLLENELRLFDPSVTGVCITEECATDRECTAGEACRNNVCVVLAGPVGPGPDSSPGDPARVRCEFDEDCEELGLEACVDGFCTGGSVAPTDSTPTDSTPSEPPSEVPGSGPGTDPGPGPGPSSGPEPTPGPGPGPTPGGSCDDVTCPAGQLCNRADGNCYACTLNESTCPDNLPYVDPVECRCVGCVVTDPDCEVGEECTALNRCLFEGRGPCSSQSECSIVGGFCQAGRCVDCIAQSDCPNQGDFCVRGQCRPCICPEGEICSPSGECVEDTATSCTSDQQCQQLATQLGAPRAQNAKCDIGGIGCFIAGECNSGIGGDDPFNAPCAQGTTCQTSGDIDLIGSLLGGGADGPASVCLGCTEGAPAGSPGGCRPGEVCEMPAPSLYDGLGGGGGGPATPGCTVPGAGDDMYGGGGGGLPLPGTY